MSVEPLIEQNAHKIDLGMIDWVIVGGESGKDARPMHPAWVREWAGKCDDADVAFFFKQHGAWRPRPYGVGRPVKLTDRVMAMHPAGMTALHPGNTFDPFAAGHPNWEWIERNPVEHGLPELKLYPSALAGSVRDALPIPRRFW